MFKKLFDYRMRSGFASVAVLVCLIWAGMNFSVSAEADFVEVEVALENAIAGSGSTCFQAMRKCDGEFTVNTCITSPTAENCFQYYCYWC